MVALAEVRHPTLFEVAAARLVERRLVLPLPPARPVSPVSRLGRVASGTALPEDAPFVPDGVPVRAEADGPVACLTKGHEPSPKMAPLRGTCLKTVSAKVGPFQEAAQKAPLVVVFHRPQPYKRKVGRNGVYQPVTDGPVRVAAAQVAVEVPKGPPWQVTVAVPARDTSSVAQVRPCVSSVGQCRKDVRTAH